MWGNGGSVNEIIKLEECKEKNINSNKYTDKQRFLDLNKIRAWIEQYYIDNDIYPFNKNNYEKNFLINKKDNI